LSSKRISPDATNAEAETTTIQQSREPHLSRSEEVRIESRQVSWWSVHVFVEQRLESAEAWPLLGTPAWCLLDDDDERKFSALLDAAQHWALRIETCQEAAAEASHDVSGAADWSSIAAANYQHASFYEARPWLKRVGSR
jgi:hypothetical protein